MLKLERAAMLVEGVSRSYQIMFDLLPDDCLIATAFVTYLGPLVSNYRG